MGEKETSVTLETIKINFKIYISIYSLLQLEPYSKSLSAFETLTTGMATAADGKDSSPISTLYMHMHVYKIKTPL